MGVQSHFHVKPNVRLSLVGFVTKVVEMNARDTVEFFECSLVLLDSILPPWLLLYCQSYKQRTIRARS